MILECSTFNQCLLSLGAWPSDLNCRMPPMELVARRRIKGLEDLGAICQMDGGRKVTRGMTRRVGGAEKAGRVSFVGDNGNGGAGQPAAGVIFEGGEGPRFGNVINRKLQRPGRMQSRRPRKSFLDSPASYGVEEVHF